MLANWKGTSHIKSEDCVEGHSWKQASGFSPAMSSRMADAAGMVDVPTKSQASKFHHKSLWNIQSHICVKMLVYSSHLATDLHKAVLTN